MSTNIIRTTVTGGQPHQTIWKGRISRQDLLMGIAVIVICALYAGIMSFKSAPITEGWYTEYAWQINHGKVPYKDFEYLFFPLYMYIIAAFTKLFGYGIFALRVLGIVVFALIGLVLFLIFTKVFNRFVGLVTAFLAVMFMQSENAQVFYDYIRFHDLFALLAVLALLLLNEQIIYRKPHSNIPRVAKPLINLAFSVVCLASGLYFGFQGGTPALAFLLCAILFASLFVYEVVWKKKCAYSATAFVCGILVSCELLIKQSNGVVMVALMIAYMTVAAFASKDKKFLHELVGILQGIMLFTALFMVYLISSGNFEQCLTCCFGSAISAKGGLATTLFAWIPQCLYIFESKLNLVLILLIIGQLLLKKWLDTKEETVRQKKTSFWMSFGSILCMVLLVLANTLSNDFYSYNAQLYDSTLAHVSFFIAVGLFLFFTIYILGNRATYKAITKQYKIVFLLFPVLSCAVAQGLGCAMSGGLSTGNTVLCLACVVGGLLWLAYESRAVLMEIVLGIVIFTWGASFVACKANQMYYWWYLAAGTIAEQTETADVPLLQGIKMKASDKACYEAVYQDVTSYSQEGEPIYVFPNAPIFYTMTDRHAETYSLVEWFDVSSANAIKEDIEVLREHNPKVIVYVSVPEDAYTSHESLFGAYQTREMRDFLLNELIPNGQYTQISHVDIGENYYVETYTQQ